MLYISTQYFVKTNIINTVCLVTILTDMIVGKCGLYQSTVNKQTARTLNISFPTYTQNFYSEKIRLPKVEVNCLYYIDNIVSEF